MAKYMIQDIIPPERKKTTHKPAAKTTPHTKPAATHEEAQVTPPVVKAAEPVHPISTTVSHAIHHVEQPEPDTEHQIHDEIAERPQSMIIENLYHGGEMKKETSPEPPAINMSGVYPYNTVERASSAPAEKEGWKFPETSNFMSGLGGWVPWIVVPIIVLGAAILIFNHFAGATVLLIPKHSTLPIPQTDSFTAYKNPADNQLGFSVMKVTLDDSREVSATGTKTVTAKASGKIVVYNEQTVAQHLIKNTRFQSTAGKIYRINDSILIPKATVKGGKTVPGTVQVTAYADEAGPDFNSDPTDFTIPGFKNLPQATKVYGRSNGPMAGGAAGTIKSVSDQDLKQVSDDLRVSLETKLRSKARGDLAPAQIAYDQGIIAQLDEPKLSTQQASAPDKAVVTESGSLYVIVFDRTALTKAIAKELVPTYSGEDIAMTNLDSLSMQIPQLTGDALAALDKLDFTVSGTPALVWQIDQERIKKELLGVNKSNFNLILSQYSNVERAKASIQPIWKSAFPTEESGITIKLVDEIPN